TIEFLARILPPKSKIIEALEKDIGMVQKILHPDSEQFSSDAEFESCYIEFAKPCKLLWTHSTIRNVPTLPDAVFLAHKYSNVKNCIWTADNSMVSNPSSDTASFDTASLDTTSFDTISFDTISSDTTFDTTSSNPTLFNPTSNPTFPSSDFE